MKKLQFLPFEIDASLYDSNSKYYIKAKQVHNIYQNIMHVF